MPGSGEHHLEFTSEFARDTELTGQWCLSCIATRELGHIETSMSIRHEGSVDHWRSTTAFPIISLNEFHSFGHMKHTISYNLHLLHCLTYSTRQYSLKDLVPVDFKGDKSTEGCGTLEKSRNYTKQAYSHIYIVIYIYSNIYIVIYIYK